MFEVNKMAELKNGAMTIQRAVVLDGLRALYLTQNRFNRILKEDGYACGYREGFEDALLSIAQMIGVADEIETVKRQRGAFEVNGSLVHQP
jgi:hypothetical protein